MIISNTHNHHQEEELWFVVNIINLDRNPLNNIYITKIIHLIVEINDLYI